MTHLIPTQKDKNINTAELAPSLPLPWLGRLVVFGLNAVQPDFAIFCHFGNFRCIWQQFFCSKSSKNLVTFLAIFSLAEKNKYSCN